MPHFKQQTPSFRLNAILSLIFFFSFQIILAQNITIPLKRGHQGQLNTYALSPSNKYLVTAGSDNQLIVWDYASGRQVREIKTPVAVTALEISADDRNLYSADTSGRVTKWDIGTGKKIFDFLAHGAKKQEYEEDEGWLGIVEIDEPMDKILDERYRRSSVSRSYLSNDIHLTLSSNGQLLISGGKDGKINVWDTNTGKLTRSLLDQNVPIAALCLSKDMKYLISQGVDRQVTLWNFTNGKAIKSFLAKATISRNFSKNGTYFSYLLKSDTLQVINLINGKVESTIPLQRWLDDFIYTSNEALIVGTGSGDTTYYLDAKTGSVTLKNADLDGSDFTTKDLKGRLVYMNKGGKKINIFDPQLKTQVAQFGVFVPDIQNIKFSGNGEHLLINDAERYVHDIDLRDPKQPNFSSYPLPYYWYRNLAELSPDSKKLAIVSADGDLTVWNTDNKTNQKNRIDYTSTTGFSHGWTRISPAITGLCFSPDGQQVILSDYTYGLYFFEVQNLSKQYFYSHLLQDENNLIKLPKDSSFLLINEMGKSYGGIYQFDLQSISKEKIDSGKFVKKFQVDYINERLIDFDVSNGNKFLAYQTDQGQGGVIEVGTNQKLLSVNNCLLAKWIGANKKYGLFVHQQKVTIWDVENQKTATQYNLPFIPVHAALHPSENLLLLVHPNQSFEIRSVVDGKLICSWFWQAGTNNFQLLNQNGQKNEEIWKSLQAQFLQSKGLEIEKLLAKTLDSNKDLPSDLPKDFEKYILNIGHSSSIKHLSIHDNGKYLWTLDETGLGKIWDLKMGRELRTVSYPMMSNDLIYAPGATPNILKFSTDGSPRSWEIDLSTGMVTENATIINIGFVFDNTGNQRIAPQYSEGTSLKFTLPNGVQITKTFKQKFTPNRGVYNPEKKIVSIYGYHNYDENFLISYHGVNFKDSTILPIDLDFRDRQIDNIWVYPGTDSLLIKTGEGNTFVFKPLSKSLQRSTFIDAEKISNLTFSPDKQFFARALHDQGVVEIRRTSNKALLKKRSLPGSKILKMSFTPSGKNLVLTDGGKIWNWDIEQDTVLQFSDFFVNYKETRSYESAGYCHLLPSGKLVFLTVDLNYQRSYKTIDLITGQTEIFELTNTSNDHYQSHDKLYVENRMGSITSVFDQKMIPFPLNISGISDVAFSNKSKHIGIIHEAQSTFTFWNVELQKIAFTRKLQEVYYKAEISYSDSLIALSSKKIVLLLHARTGKELKRIPVETGGSSQVRLKFSPDNRYLFINCPYEGIIILWDLLIGKEFKRFSFKNDSGHLIGVASSNQTFYGVVNGAVFAYNQEGKELYRVQLKERDIKIEYFPNDQKIIVASNKGIIYQIDAPTGTILHTIYLGNYQNWIAVDQNNQIRTSSSAARYVHYRTKQGAVGLLFGKNRVIHEPLPSLLQPKNSLTSTSSNEVKVNSNPFAFVNDKWKANLVGSSMKKIDFQGPRINSQFFTSPITQVKFAQNDEIIVAQEESGSIHFIERAGFRLLKSLKIENPSQVPFVLSTDERFLVCLDGKQTIHLYQLSNGELIQKRTLTNSAISALTISSNGQFLLVGTLDGQIYTCKLPDLNVIHNLYASEARIVQIKMNNESNKVIIANANSDFVSFDLSPGHQLVNPVFIGNLGSFGFVNQLEFTSNQKVVVFTRDLVYSLTLGISGSFQKVFMYPKEGAAVLLDPSNQNQFYYQNERSYPSKWYLYDMDEKKQIDSIPNSNIFLAVSRNKKFAITNSSFTRHYLYPFDMVKQQDIPMEGTTGFLKNLVIDNHNMHYIQGEFEGQAYQIDLLTSNTSTLPGTYDTGNFILEKGNWNFTGRFLKQPRGVGKKSLRDTSFMWKLSGDLETIATSENGYYLAHSAYKKDTVYVYAALTQKLVYKLHIPKNDNSYFFISDDGKFLVVKKYLGSAEAMVFDLTNQKLLFVDKLATGRPSFSNDSKYLFLPGIQTIRVYDLISKKIVKEHPFENELLFPMFRLSNPKFGIVASSTDYYQLWDKSKGLLLGKFNFFKLKNNPPAWTFTTPDGRFDGSPDGLKQLYYIEENRLRSKEVDLKNDPKYQPGLLSKVLK